MINKIRWKERFCQINQKAKNFIEKNKSKKCIWINAVSIGESIAAIPLINALCNKGFFIVLTTTTITSADFIKEKLPESAIHQYFPIPIKIFIRKFLKIWNPWKVICIESEIWPGMVKECVKTRDIILINGKLSDKSYKWWKRFSFYSKTIFSKYKLILTIDENNIQRFKSFGSKDVRYIGNLKNANITNFANELEKSKTLEKYSILENIIKDQIIITFGSTHAGEEEIIIETFHKLRQKYNNIIFILAIRHPKRTNELELLLQNNNINYICSSGLFEKNNLNMIIVDEIGQMPLFYGVSNISIVCGSFIDKIGGHNPLEPIALKKPTIIGPFHENCKSIVDELLRKNAIIVSNNLEKDIINLIENKELINNLSKNSSQYINDNKNIIDNIISLIT